MTGNIYVSDWANNRIYKITSSTGIISTIAGTGSYGFTGNGGAATSATLKNPDGVTLDSSGNIYIAGHYDHSVRKVTVSTGIITLFAGTGSQGFSGDSGAATSARLAYPHGVVVDNSGALI